MRAVATQRRQSYVVKIRGNSSYVPRPRYVSRAWLQSHRKPASSTRVLPRVHRDYPRTTNRYNCSAKYSELERKKRKDTFLIARSRQEEKRDQNSDRLNRTRCNFRIPGAALAFPSWRLSGSELLISDYHSFTRHSRKNIISTHLCVDAP